MRKIVVAGNWKMNKQFPELESFTSELLSVNMKDYCKKVDVMLFPPAVYAAILNEKLSKNGINIGLQNVSEYEKGAYTGEISAQIISSMNLKYCIIGHSERRKYFHEDHQILKKKMQRLHENTIAQVFCCGEQLEDRNSGCHFEVVKSQIEDSVLSLPQEVFKNVIIAYEPVWAIGTGVNASPDQAQEMHAFIRNMFAEKVGTNFAEKLRILYGGSVSAENNAELFACPDIDGGLIGGASLKADSLIKIIENSIEI